MKKQLAKIAENLIKAAELLENNPSTPAIENLIGETTYEIKRLEAYAETLVENIELTIKTTKP